MFAEIEVDEDGNLIEKLDEDESGYEDDNDDEDYKPSGKSKPKAKPAANTRKWSISENSIFFGVLLDVTFLCFAVFIFG